MPQSPPQEGGKVVGEDEPVEGQRRQTRFVMTNIFERVGEDWKIARHHAAVITEPQ